MWMKQYGLQLNLRHNVWYQLKKKPALCQPALPHKLIGESARRSSCTPELELLTMDAHTPFPQRPHQNISCHGAKQHQHQFLIRLS